MSHVLVLPMYSIQTHDTWCTVRSLSASLLQRISEATQHQCQTALNQNSMHRF